MADSTTPGINQNQKDPLLWQPQAHGFWASARQSNTGAPDLYKTVMFPSELGTMRYPYYMMFYVNVNSKTELGKTMNTSKGVSSSGVGQAVGQNQGTQTVAQNVSTSVQYGVQSAIQGAGTVASGAIAGGDAAPKLKEFIDNVASKTASVMPTFKGINKRLDMAIALPIPATLSYGSGANYDTITSGTLGTLLNTATNEGIGAALGVGAKKILQDAPTALFNDEYKKISGLYSKLNDTNTGADVAQIAHKLMGIAHNERKEQLFKNMTTRTFNFSWLLIPRTQEESDTIKDVIKWFKWHMHPEVEDKYGLNLLIPNEFDIEFHYNSDEMTGLSKISTCVLEAVDVNYTPLGKFVAFDGTDNPVAIVLSLRFREIEPLTRTQVGLGY